MKKSILFGFSTIVLCLTMIVAVSYAAFTSSDGFSGNNVTTSKVEIDTTLYFEGNIVENISITNMSPGDSRTYRLVINNTSTTKIAYRTVFNVTGNDEVFSGLNINVDSSTVEFNSYRGTSSWVNGINSVYNEVFVTVSLSNSIPTSAQGKTVDFDFDVEAIYDNFVVVSNQDDLDSLVENEYAVLSSDFNSATLNINKNVYLDLNNKTLDTLNIKGDNVTFVELVNGTTANLVADAPNATIYANIDVTNSLDLNVSMNSFYLKNDLDTFVTTTVSGGKVVFDTPSELEVNVVMGDSVLIQTSKQTVITKLELEDGANQSIVVQNSGEIVDVVLNGTNQNIEIENETVLVKNETFEYVTLDGSGVYYSADESSSYKNEAISFEDFLNNPSGVFYFEGGTYLLDSTLLLESDVEIYGLNNVVFEKASGSSYASNTLIDAKANVVLSNIIFNDHTDSNIASTCLTSYNELKVVNCEFNYFAKNSIRLNSGEAYILNSLFNYVTKNGAAGNGIVVAGGATALIEGNEFSSYMQGSDVWAATSVLVYDGGHADIYDNTFIGCKYAIVLTYMYTDNVATFNEYNNTFTDVTYGVSIQDDGVYIVSTTSSSSYSYTDELTGYRHTFFGKSYDNIQDALNDASDYSYVYVKEGTYDVATKINNVDANLYIAKPVNLYAVGDVTLTTQLSGGSNGISQQTVYICASDVVFDGFNVLTTTVSPNKGLEIASGSNIVVSNNTISGGSIYIGGPSVGDYYILNNEIINTSIGITVTNGAGNASTNLSEVSSNVSSGALFLTGTRTNGWDVNDLEVLPKITNNTFGYYSQVINNVEYNYYIRYASKDSDKLPTFDESLELLKANNFTDSSDKTISYTTVSIAGSGTYEGQSTNYGFVGFTTIVEDSEE